MIKHVQKRRGGPPSKAYLDAYPGNDHYVEHLKLRFNLIFKVPAAIPSEQSHNFF